MADLIDRQAAIDRINKQREHLEPDVYPQDKIGDAAYRVCAEFIERLPSAQPELMWIPCSEWLPEHPENDDYYLVTIQCEHHDGWDDYVTGFAEWTKHGWDELSCYIGQIKVVAWMPLPEPYKEDSDDC